MKMCLLFIAEELQVKNAMSMTVLEYINVILVVLTLASTLKCACS